MADVFISKSTKDDAIALSLYDVLEKNGVDCWISNVDLVTNPTDLYARDIVDAILEAKAVLLLLSVHSNKSRHVMNEISTACDHGKKVFVLQIDDVVPAKEFDYYLSQEQRIIDVGIRTSGDYSAVAHALLNYFNLDERIKNGNFTDAEYVRRENFRKLKKETLEKRLSYSMSIADGKEDEYDTAHYYEKIIRLDIVDNRKDQWSSYRFLTIRNDSDNYTNHIVHKECGEDKARFSDMRIRAFANGIKGQRLSVESMTAIQPNLIQVFKIHFQKPLAPGETLCIFYRLDWPNEPCSYYKDELSQSISLSRYKKGVGALDFGVYEPYEMTSSHMMEVTKMNERIVSSIPYVMQPLDDVELLEPLHGKGFKGVRYSIDNPQSILYQILYKVEYETEEIEEDFF